MKTILPLILSSILFSSCGKDYSWKQGERRYGQGLYAKALPHYARFLKRAANAGEKTKAHLALGRCHAKLENYERAREHFESAAQISPFIPEAREAAKEMLEMEDYLPLQAGGRWEEVDSDTKGLNMYAESTVEEHPSTYLVRRKIYAGKRPKKLVREVLYFYTKEPGLVWERPADPNSKNATLVLRYPYLQGQSWKTSRDGREVRRTVTRDRLTVRVAAGEFSRCVEIAEGPDEGSLSMTGRIYDTYCQGVGRVKTSVGDGQKISALSELAAYKKF